MLDEAAEHAAEFAAAVALVGARLLVGVDVGKDPTVPEENGVDPKIDVEFRGCDGQYFAARLEDAKNLVDDCRGAINTVLKAGEKGDVNAVGSERQARGIGMH